jgi:O-acetyl-ADP-ribose deacetylase (regulator of RNase III)
VAVPLSVHHGSVLEATADAIVNAANSELIHGGGVAAAIARAAGPELEAESRRVAPCPIGEAVATTAGRLLARGIRWVIHVPTIDYRSGRRAEPADLAAGVRAALSLARSLGCQSVAFPLLGAGIAGLDPTAAVRAMAAGLADCNDLTVTLCAFSPQDRAAVSSIIP